MDKQVKQEEVKQEEVRRKTVTMTATEWAKTHKDYKGIIGGKRCVLREGGLVPVQIENARGLA